MNAGPPLRDNTRQCDVRFAIQRENVFENCVVVGVAEFIKAPNHFIFVPGENPQRLFVNDFSQLNIREVWPKFFCVLLFRYFNDKTACRFAEKKRYQIIQMVTVKRN